MNKKRQTTRRRAPLLFAALGVLVLAVAVGAYLLLAAGLGEQPADLGERPYVGGDLHSLVVDPTNPERVMVGGHEGGAISDDGGETWWQASGLEGADPMSWVIDPSDPLKMYVGGHPGFYRSEDGGETLTRTTRVFPAPTCTA